MTVPPISGKRLSCGMHPVIALCLCMAAFLVNTGCAAGWLEPQCTHRLSLTSQADLAARDAGAATVCLNFNDILGTDSVLTASSLMLRDADSGEKVALALAQEARVAYPSGNPILQLRWTAPPIAAFAEKRWDLYFRAVPRGSPKAWVTLAKAIATDDALWSNGFEKPGKKGADQPTDFIIGGADNATEKSELIRTDKEAHPGEFSLKISRTMEAGAATNPNRPFWGMSGTFIPVEEGVSYQFSAWMKTVRLAGKGNQAKAVLVYRDEKKAHVKKDFWLALDGPVRATDWICRSTITKAPPGARYATVELLLAGTGEIYFDDVTLRAAPGDAQAPLGFQVGALESATRTDEAATRAGSEQRPKPLRVAPAAKPPKLDGVLDDPCWQNASVISSLGLFPRSLETQRLLATEVFLCADLEALYIAFDCAEPETDKIVAVEPGRDVNIWRDDAVELFLDTKGDRKSYYQIAVNAKGAIYDLDTGLVGVPSESWNGPINAATRIYKNRWAAEVKIAYVGLRLAETEGKAWTANFCRTSRHGGNQTGYSWGDAEGTYGDVKKFRDIELPVDPSKDTVAARLLAPEELHFGNSRLPVVITNRRPEPARVRVRLTAASANKRLEAARSVVEVPADGTVTAELPCTFPVSGHVQLTMELTDVTTGKPLYVTSSIHQVMPPLRANPGAHLSYLSEEHVALAWKLGLAAEAILGSRIVVSIMSPNASILRTITIIPREPAGASALHVGGLPPGDYVVRVELIHANKRIVAKDAPLSRIAGPFDALMAGSTRSGP